MPARLADLCFKLVHRHNLVYNTCWEDPRLDREALRLKPGDRVLTITSAGCNALDYVLDEPGHIFAVDLNPRQTALLELKQAAIRALDFEQFAAMFGQGRLAHWQHIYQASLRPQLSPWSRNYWDRRSDYFGGGAGRSFYFRGTAGAVARAMNAYIDHVAKIRDAVSELLDASTVDEQRTIYQTRLRDRLWRPWLRWLTRQPAFLSMLAVPRPQRDHLERDYPGGIADFIAECVETVFASLPLQDNYFWRVYLTGTYSSSCCPSYLQPLNFQRLKAGLVDRISTHTASIHGFLEALEEPISHFVLLDHMDWLCNSPAVLEAEWHEIVRRATRGARLIWRSGGRHTRFVEDLSVRAGRGVHRLGDLLAFDRAHAAALHERDRVHTYGSFHVATLTV